MRTIYKYPITVTDEFTITLPRGAEILHVAVQNYKPYLWALVDPEQPAVLREFAVRGTGQLIREDNLRYLGSFMLNDDTFVGHLFERVESSPGDALAERLRRRGALSPSGAAA